MFTTSAFHIQAPKMIMVTASLFTLLPLPLHEGTLGLEAGFVPDILLNQNTVCAPSSRTKPTSSQAGTSELLSLTNERVFIKRSILFYFPCFVPDSQKICLTSASKGILE
jgi:hypothetical protein